MNIIIKSIMNETHTPDLYTLATLIHVNGIREMQKLGKCRNWENE
jgi:hypothetical protein